MLSDKAKLQPLREPRVTLRLQRFSTVDKATIDDVQKVKEQERQYWGC